MSGSRGTSKASKQDKAAKSTADDTRRLVPRPLVRRPGDGPDFLCVGAHKGGTRWLYDQLQAHPDFWMPPVKELHYLDHRRPSEVSVRLQRKADRNLARTNRRRAKIALRPLDQRDVDFLAGFVGMTWWRTDLDAYASLFSPKGGLISGDITPDYSRLSERIIARFMRRFPKARVIFIARDPVERVWSHVTMRMGRGLIERGIDVDGVMRLVRQRVIATRSYPSEIVARWRRHVPEDQFGLFLFDDLAGDADELRRRILTFLGADPRKESGAIPPAFNRKEDGNKAALSPEIRDRLGRHFADELRASGEAFGGAATGWAAKYGL